MSKKLVAYFSASGVTERAAAKVAKAADADLFEIKPKIPYTTEDLNWMNKQSRSSIEMSDPSSRPEIEERVEGMEMCIRDSSGSDTEKSGRRIRRQLCGYKQDMGFARVYKGQRLHDKETCDPVSYTHLDVYKRQVQGQAYGGMTDIMTKMSDLDGEL